MARFRYKYSLFQKLFKIYSSFPINSIPNAVESLIVGSAAFNYVLLINFLTVF